MNRQKAELLLASIIISRSTAMLFSKISLQHMGMFNLLALRFLIAFLFLCLLFWRKIITADLKTILSGSLLGATFFSVMMLEMIGLKSTNTSTTALLENTAIVFVPLFEGVLRRRFPKTPTMLSALLALSGVALITLKGGNFKLTTGEIACLVAAIFYASAIILTDRLSRKNDTLVLGIFQIGFLGLFASIAAFLIEQPHLPNSNVEWGSILILAFVCTSFGFTLQPFAQSHTTSERASVFCALNPVFTSILGVIFLHENLGFLGTLGALLVLSSIFLPHLLQFKFKPGG